MAKIAAERFRVILEGPLGGLAASAGAMALFRGSLYVGTSMLAPAEAASAACIMRYEADGERWQTVYEPPSVAPTPRFLAPDLQFANEMQGAARPSPLSESNGVPRDEGYRSMCILPSGTEAEDSLHVSSMSRSGGVLLRSSDGRHFEEAGGPAIGNPDLYSLANLTAFEGRLFATPAGTVADHYLDPHVPPEATVYVADTGAGNAWVQAAEPGFGDPANTAIASLCAAHGRLYAGTLNGDRGFQLWATRAEGSPPYEWTRVIVDGAGAFNQNPTVTAMAEYQGALYVGTGVTGHGYDVVNDIGPASAELIRVHPDGSWDLIAGRMRFSRDGLKVPLSLLAPGLGDFYNSAISALAEHEGVLYLGTSQWEALRALELDIDPLVGGYQLWASENGEDWELIIDDGQGNPAQLGIAALLSTPLGLIVGTRNESGLLKLAAGRKNRRVETAEGFKVLLGK